MLGGPTDRSCTRSSVTDLRWSHLVLEELVALSESTFLTILQGAYCVLDENHFLRKVDPWKEEGTKPQLQEAHVGSHAMPHLVSSLKKGCCRVIFMALLSISQLLLLGVDSI